MQLTNGFLAALTGAKQRPAMTNEAGAALCDIRLAKMEALPRFKPAKAAPPISHRS